jgi:hypothetical protein
MLAPHITETPPASTPTEPTEDDEKLSALAKSIRAAHTTVQFAMRHAVARALSCGDLLIQAKAAVPSGRWQRWLRTNCKLSTRTAQRYVQLAQHRAEIEDKLASWPDFSVRAAQRLVSKRKVVATDKGTEVQAQAPPPSVNTAVLKLAKTLTLALRTALSKQAKAEETAPSLNAILTKLSARGLDLHDIAIIVRPRSSARTRRRAKNSA